MAGELDLERIAREREKTDFCWLEEGMDSKFSK